MFDLTLRYRECGAECREDWLRMLACENGLPLADVQRAATTYFDRRRAVIATVRPEERTPAAGKKSSATRVAKSRRKH